MSINSNFDFMWYVDDIEIKAYSGLGIAQHFEFAGDEMFIDAELDDNDKLMIAFCQWTKNNTSSKNIRISLLDQRPIAEPEHFTCHTTLDPENEAVSLITTNISIDDIRQQKRYFSPKYTDNGVLKLIGNISFQ